MKNPAKDKITEISENQPNYLDNLDQDNFIKAQTLSQALPFIQEFHNKTIVVKLGSSTLDASPERLLLFIQDIVLLKTVGIHPILIHGGGAKISEFLNKLGKESRFIDGLRVTDSETMDMTQMVLSGLINKNLVSLIAHKGGKAMGLSGKDGNIAIGKRLKKNNHDYGRVGHITHVNSELILNSIQLGYIPVIAPVAIEGNHKNIPTQNSLNINADTFATEIALSINAEKLIFISDVPGVLRDPHNPNSLISSLKLKEISPLIKKKIVNRGMIPKLQAAQKALTHGVGKVHFVTEKINHVLLIELLTKEGVGTLISK